MITLRVANPPGVIGCPFHGCSQNPAEHLEHPLTIGLGHHGQSRKVLDEQIALDGEGNGLVTVDHAR